MDVAGASGGCDVEPFVLPGATHVLHLQQPRALAEALAAFFARHPLA